MVFAGRQQRSPRERLAEICAAAAAGAANRSSAAQRIGAGGKCAAGAVAVATAAERRRSSPKRGTSIALRDRQLQPHPPPPRNVTARNPDISNPRRPPPPPVRPSHGLAIARAVQETYALERSTAISKAASPRLLAQLARCMREDPVDQPDSAAGPAVQAASATVSGSSAVIDELVRPVATPQTDWRAPRLVNCTDEANDIAPSPQLEAAHADSTKTNVMVPHAPPRTVTCPSARRPRPPGLGLPQQQREHAEASSSSSERDGDEAVAAPAAVAVADGWLRLARIALLELSGPRPEPLGEEFCAGQQQPLDRKDEPSASMHAKETDEEAGEHLQADEDTTNAAVLTLSESEVAWARMVSKIFVLFGAISEEEDQEDGVTEPKADYGRFPPRYRDGHLCFGDIMNESVIWYDADSDDDCHSPKQCDETRDTQEDGDESPPHPALKAITMQQKAPGIVPGMPKFLSF